jgi:probable phosphomutase (TIGR03848 family)
MPPRRRRTPPPTLVLLVRHGQTPTTGAVLPGRAAGLHLSDKGRAQAEAVAARIAQVKKVAAVYSSPLERTRDTAGPIARAHGLRVRNDKGLLECDFGDWTGAALKDLAKLPEWAAVQSRPSRFRFPGGESFAEMQLRVVSTVQRLALAHAGKAVVAVSHADPIKAAVSEATGAHLDAFQRLVISPCSVTAMLVGERSTTLLTMNSLGDDLTALVPS